MARPSIYSEEIIDKICEKISTSSKGLHSICKEEGMPSFNTVFYWLNDPDKKEFLNKYARAREAQADYLADEIIDISDFTKNDDLLIENKEGSYETPNHEWISRSKLRVDARKWKASKLYPKKYGDKIDVTTGGEKLINPRKMKLPDGTEIDL